MTLEPEPLSPKMSLRVNELAYVICDEVATGNLIRCSDWRNVVHYLCTSLPAHQIYNLISSNRKFTCANRTEEEYKNIVQLITDSALIEFQEKLDQLEVEMHPLQTGNKMLRRKNVTRSNKIETLKVMHSSKTEKKESHFKELQNKLRQANKIAADKTKELHQLNLVIVPEEQGIMPSWGRKNLSLRNKNDITSTQIGRNRETDSLATDLEDFKKFVTEELFSLKTCVETVRNRGTDQNCETTEIQKSLN